MDALSELASAVGWAGVTACGTAVLAAVAIPTLLGTRKQLRLLREQAEWEGRPYVSLTVVSGLHGPGHWDLVVQNHGKTIARQVVIDVGHLPPRDADDHISAGLEKYLNTARDLSPGGRERVMWRMEAETKGDPPTAGAAQRVTARLTYQDSRGKPYKDTFHLDAESLVIAPVPFEGPKVQGGDSKELANIDRALRTLNVHIGELRR